MSPNDPTLCLEGPMPQAASAMPLRDVVLRLVEAGVFPAVVPDAILGTIWASVHGFVILELSGLFAPADSEQRHHMYEAHLESIRRGWRVA